MTQKKDKKGEWQIPKLRSLAVKSQDGFDHPAVCCGGGQIGGYCEGGGKVSR